MSKIILLRGNSGSGKSTVAKALQRRLGSGALLLSQDYVRREMLGVKDRPNNQAIDLLMHLVAYGRQNCDFTIVEGILYADVYENLFRQIQVLFAGHIFAYYFEIPFEETLKRHRQKPNACDFGEEEMKRWWRDGDALDGIREVKIGMNENVEQTVSRIGRHLGVLAAQV